MMKLTRKVCLLSLLFPALLNGQETGLLRIDPDRPAREGEAAVWGGVEEGRFKPTHAASFQWSAGADAKIVRHGKKSSYLGAMSFEQMTGNGMGSSLLLEPGYFPLDLVETGLGTKSRQTGRLEAAFLTDIGLEWAAGLKASAKVMNSAKRQDIPHSAFGLEAQLEPTLTYVMDDDMGLVSSYLVRLRTERIQSTLPEDAVLFLDKGMRYGTMESALGLFPIMEVTQGFNELLHSPDFSVGLGFSWKSGKAGQDYGRFRFPGHTLKAFFEYTYQADAADHVCRISYQKDRDYLRESDGAGYSPVADRKARDLGLKYEARLLSSAMKSVGVDLDVDRWTECVWRPALLDAYLGLVGTAALTSSFAFGPVDLDLDVQAAAGRWIDRNVSDAAAAAGPDRMRDDWLKNIEYRTTPRVGMGGTVTGHLSKSLYVQLYGYWHRAFSVSYLGGKNREIATLKVGYKF